jgi:hypothetical protein
MVWFAIYEAVAVTLAGVTRCCIWNWNDQVFLASPLACIIFVCEDLEVNCKRWSYYCAAFWKIPSYTKQYRKQCGLIFNLMEIPDIAARPAYDRRWWNVDIVLDQLFSSMQRFLRPLTPKRNNILGLEELILIKTNRNNLSDFKHT